MVEPMIRCLVAAAALLSLLPVSLGPDGYGAVKFGQPLATADRAVGARTDNRRLAPACDVVAFNAYPGVRFMVENGVITRADLLDLTLPNSTGITAAMTLDEIRRRHPEAIVAPHKYDPQGQTVVIRSPGRPRAVVLETSGGRIIRIRAGLQPAVEYVEGCG